MRQGSGPPVRSAEKQLSRLPGVRAARRLFGVPEPDDALALAVRLYRSPGLARSIRRSPLPGGVILVIRIAAGCPTSCAQAVETTGLDEQSLTRIATLYLLVALFGEDADAHRTLGIVPGSPSEEVQDHRKWLLKWLHPDRNRNPALAGLSVRVLAASAHIATLPPPEPIAAPEPKSELRRKRRRWVPLPIDG